MNPNAFAFNVIDVRLPEDIAERVLLLTSLTGQTATDLITNAARAEINRQFNDALGTLPEDRRRLILERVRLADEQVAKARQEASQAADRFQEATRHMAADEARSVPKPRPVAERLAERAQAFLDGWRKTGVQGDWARQELDRIIRQLGEAGVAGRLNHSGGEFDFERDIRGVFGLTGYEPLNPEQVEQVRQAFKPGSGATSQPRAFNVGGKRLVGA